MANEKARFVIEEDFKDADRYGFLPVWIQEPKDFYCECILVDALARAYEERRVYWLGKPTEEQMAKIHWDEKDIEEGE